MKLDIFEELSTRILESKSEQTDSTKGLLRFQYNLDNVTDEDKDIEKAIRYYLFLRKIWNDQRKVQNIVEYFIERCKHDPFIFL